MKTSPSPALHKIRAFRSLGRKLGTSGQPTAAQFRAIHNAGFKAVINLALPTSDHALADEGSVVTRLGMAYVHIPVDFAAPKAGDFRVFSRAMQMFAGRPVYVHCAANMRVSAFVYLYRILHGGVSEARARRDLHAIWEPDEVWGRFIKRVLKDR